MKKIIFFVASLFLVVHLAFGTDKVIKTETTSTSTQNNITGKVIDKLTGEGLVGVEIRLIGTDIKVYSDLDGNFAINNAPAGAQAIKISYISYEETVENVYSKPDSSKGIIIKLKTVQK